MRNQRLTACALVLYGFLMAVAPPKVYTSGTYTVAFDLADAVAPDSVRSTTVWGVGFLAVGLIGLSSSRRLRHWIIGVSAGLICAWSAALWLAVWPRGTAQTWGGPIWPTLVGLLILVNAGQPRR